VIGQWAVGDSALLRKLSPDIMTTHINSRRSSFQGSDCSFDRIDCRWLFRAQPA